MKRSALLACLVLGCTILSCDSGTQVAPRIPPETNGRLDVFVQWQGQGVADRRLEILESGQEQRTDPAGRASFSLEPGSYTLRAYVNGPGPAIPRDFGVTIQRGQTERVEVTDCLPCVNAH